RHEIREEQLMGAVLNWGMKEGFKIRAHNERWNVLTAIMLHMNERNRAWPTMDTIAESGTNRSRNDASGAKKWLLEHGAIRLIPYSKRIGKELKLPPRRHVYEVTGSFTVNGTTYPYLYMNPNGGGDDESDDGEDYAPNRTGRTGDKKVKS